MVNKVNSWLNLKNEDDKWALPKSIRDEDQFQGVDVGWVEQMRPFIKEFSQAGDVILDPFAGLGTTLVASEIEGRRSIGIEVEPKRIKLITERWSYHGLQKENLHCERGDCVSVLKQIINSSDFKKVDLCLTSVPYFDCQWQGNCSGQLYGEKQYSEYLTYLKNLMFLLRSAVVEGGFIIFMAENIRSQSGTLKPIAWDIGSLLKKYFLLYDERVIVYGEEPYSTDKPNIHTSRSHEYVLVAQNARLKVPASEAENYLKGLYSAGNDFVLYGGFEEVLNGGKTSTTDVDLLLDDSLENKISVLMNLYNTGYDIFLKGHILRDDEINPEFLSENKHRYFRCISQGCIQQLDLVFLEDKELKKIDVKIDMFPRASCVFEINDEWIVVR